MKTKTTKEIIKFQIKGSEIKRMYELCKEDTRVRGGVYIDTNNSLQTAGVNVTMLINNYHPVFEYKGERDNGEGRCYFMRYSDIKRAINPILADIDKTWDAYIVYADEFAAIEFVSKEDSAIIPLKIV